MERVGTICALWRYPVKSLRGERLERAELDARGVVGDRIWGLVDQEGKIASGKHSRRFRKVADLMHHGARYEGTRAVLTLADGREIAAEDPAASEAVEAIAGPEWRLAREASVSHFDAGAVHLVTSATLERLSDAIGARVEPERLRPNIVVDVSELPPFVEDSWVGCELLAGDARFRVTSRTQRCVMTNLSQSGLPYRRELLKAIGKANAVHAGVYLEILEPGTLAPGQEVRLSLRRAPEPAAET